MRIIFGTGSFRLLHKKPSELGLPSDLDAHITIEKRQEYFHLFWIPFFSVGQTWIMKKNGDKNRYDVPDEIKSHLQSNYPKHKAPWYTYFLSYTLLVAFVGFVCLAIVNSIINKIDEKNYTEYFNNLQREEINNALPNTYIGLRNNESYQITLRVLSSDKTHLKCALSNRQDSPGGTFDSFANAFLPDSNGVSYVIDTLMVSKEELLDAHNNDFYTAVKKKITIGKFTDLRMDGSYYLDMPIFEVSNFEIHDSVFKVTLKNTHVASKILGISKDPNTGNDIQIRPIAPKNLEIGDTMHLQGKVVDQYPSFYGSIKYKSKYNHEDSVKFHIHSEGIEIRYDPLRTNK